MESSANSCRQTKDLGNELAFEIKCLPNLPDWHGVLAAVAARESLNGMGGAGRAAREDRGDRGVQPAILQRVPTFGFRPRTTLLKQPKNSRTT